MQIVSSDVIAVIAALFVPKKESNFLEDSDHIIIFVVVIVFHFKVIHLFWAVSQCLRIPIR